MVRLVRRYMNKQLQQKEEARVTPDDINQVEKNIMREIARLQEDLGGGGERGGSHSRPRSRRPSARPPSGGNTPEKVLFRLLRQTSAPQPVSNSHSRTSINSTDL